jgi:hypothetical protein
MSSITPFLRGEAFDPEMIKTLTTAFEGAWGQLDATHHVSAAPTVAEKTREILAKRIIAMARTGERSPDRLRRGGLVIVMQNEQLQRRKVTNP